MPINEALTHAQFEQAHAIVADWVRGRKTYIDGEAYNAAIDLVAFAISRAISATAQPVADDAAAQSDDLVAFIRDVAAQKPEKPDYWSSCGQCGHNIERAQDLLEAHPTPQAGAGRAETRDEVTDKGGDRG